MSSSESSSEQDQASRIRRRALRAAQAASLCLALAGGTLSATGCGIESHVANDGSVGPSDGGTSMVDADCNDTREGFDCLCENNDWMHDADCCEAEGGWWQGNECAIAIPGPFVPPSFAA